MRICCQFILKWGNRDTHTTNSESHCPKSHMHNNNNKMDCTVYQTAITGKGKGINMRPEGTKIVSVTRQNNWRIRVGSSLFYEPCMLYKYPYVTPLEAGRARTQGTQLLGYQVPRLLFQSFGNDSYLHFFYSHIDRISPLWELMCDGCDSWWWQIPLRSHKTILHNATKAQKTKFRKREWKPPRDIKPMKIWVAQCLGPTKGNAISLGISNAEPHPGVWLFFSG